jgi:hypothetical protein
MPNTTRGLPYPAGSDTPDGAAQIEALARGIDAVYLPPGSRALQANGLSVPNNTAFKITGGYVAVGDDEGNGVLNYAAGIFTATRGCIVDVMAFVSWPANTTGERRLDVVIGGNTYRATTTAAATTANIGQAVTIPGVGLTTGQTIQCTLFQNSGAAVTPFRHELRAILRRLT